MPDKEIEIPVLVKTTGAQDGTVAGIGRFATVFQRAFGAIKSHPYVVAVIAIVGTMTKTVLAWKEQQSAVSSLNQVLINQGIYTKDLSQSYQDMALAIQTTTAFSDEEVIKAQASMQAYLRGQTISRELMIAVTDFATGKGMDLATAADLVGKSIGTNLNALSKFGIVLDEGMTQAQRTAAVLEGLQAKWGGQAQSAAQGLGAINQMKNALNRVMETMGRAFEPFVVAAAKGLTQLFRTLSNSREFVEGIGNSLEVMGTFATIMKEAIVGAFNSMSVVFRTSLKASAELYFGHLDNSLKEFQRGRTEVGKIILTSKKKIGTALTASKQRIVENSTQTKDATQRATEEGIASRRHQYRQGQEKLNALLQARGQTEIFEQIARNNLKNNAQYLALNRRWLAETDTTKRLELELKKRKMQEEAMREAQIQFSQKNNMLGAISDKEVLSMHQSVFDKLSEARDSQYGPQVIIGRIAAVANIGVNTAIGIAGAYAALSEIPYIGVALADAVSIFLAAYGAEQIANIVGSSIDNPGKIGGLDFSWPKIREQALSHILGEHVGDVEKHIGQLFNAGGSLIQQTSGALSNEIKKLGAVGEIVGSIIDIGAAIAGEVLKGIGAVFTAIGEAIASIISGIIKAIFSVLEDIGEFLFGWLFAEGGVVTHPGGGHPSVTPLNKSGLQLGVTLNVTIKGGLIPTAQEAKRIAALAAQQMR